MYLVADWVMPYFVAYNHIHPYCFLSMQATYHLKQQLYFSTHPIRQ